jgi:hypothetical protein
MTIMKIKYFQLFREALAQNPLWMILGFLGIKIMCYIWMWTLGGMEHMEGENPYKPESKEGQQSYYNPNAKFVLLWITALVLSHGHWILDAIYDYFMANAQELRFNPLHATVKANCLRANLIVDNFLLLALYAVLVERINQNYVHILDSRYFEQFGEELEKITVYKNLEENYGISNTVKMFRDIAVFLITRLTRQLIVIGPFCMMLMVIQEMIKDPSGKELQFNRHNANMAERKIFSEGISKICWISFVLAFLELVDYAISKIEVLNGWAFEKGWANNFAANVVRSVFISFRATIGLVRLLYPTLAVWRIMRLFGAKILELRPREDDPLLKTHLSSFETKVATYGYLAVPLIPSIMSWWSDPISFMGIMVYISVMTFLYVRFAIRKNFFIFSWLTGMFLVALGSGVLGSNFSWSNAVMGIVLFPCMMIFDTLF